MEEYILAQELLDGLSMRVAMRVILQREKVDEIGFINERLIIIKILINIILF